MLQRIFEAASSTFAVLGAVLLPTVVCCLVLSLLAWWQNRSLMRTFGWRSLLLTGWLGTPVHELSHAAACLVFNHKVTELQLFRPNPLTGQLGHVTHTYNPRNPYAAVLGNAIIPLAPLFGGALVILLLTAVFMPELISRPEDPSTSIAVTSDEIDATASQPGVFRESVGAVRRLGQAVLSSKPWRRWQFYVYSFMVFCIAMHLSPSRQDFDSFLKPALVLVAMLFLIMFVILLLADFSDAIQRLLWGPLTALNGLLIFAIAVSFVGTVLVTAITFLMNQLLR